jgi:hypothetical protein
MSLCLCLKMPVFHGVHVCIDIPSGGVVCASSFPCAELSVPGCLYVVMTVCRGVPCFEGSVCKGEHTVCISGCACASISI